MTMRWFFVFSVVSGFCSLVYEVVWLRLSMAAFGVTTPMVSVVLSVFMAGLALGSWAAGRLCRGLDAGRALRFYALSEIVIGVSGITVPGELRAGRALLTRFGGEVAWASSAHYLAAGVWVALVLLPFCFAMGATLPLMMAAIRRWRSDFSARSFSYLYLGNVIGAASGTLVSAIFLVELLGFEGTLLTTAVLNGVLALFALRLARSAASTSSSAPGVEPARTALETDELGIPWLLFLTGLVCMAMEVVWVRQFTPFLGTVVYAFATILALYLGATFLGSLVYRKWAASRSGGADPHVGLVWIAAGVFALFPLLAGDPRLSLEGGFGAAVERLALGIGPFCFAAGFLTPMLVDRWSRGDPDRAGSVYAVNVLGCIVGPLVACFGLLPLVGERWSLALLSLPLLSVGVGFAARAANRAAGAGSAWLIGPAAAAVSALALLFLTRDYETIFARRRVLRDSTATVIAKGEGMNKQLLVNGYGMTILTPITKMMAHLPLAFHARQPRRALVLCFGMGTSFRSTLSWGIPATSVELIPSVPALFGYFHGNAQEVLASPGARVVVDDGRRFLERTRERYDVITVDPPPPIQAAGSSLLYSREFFGMVRSRLEPDGILQQWFPGGDPVVVVAISKALHETFPYVRVFNSHEGWGFHFLASTQPIPSVSAAALAERLPPRAAVDLVEWGPHSKPEEFFQAVLRRELSFPRILGAIPDAPTLRDDRPVNEYYFLRTAFGASR